MTEFKLAPELQEEISAFSSAGKSLNDDYSALEEGCLQTLSTCEQYLSQHAQIKALIEAYIKLVNKDVNDLTELQKTVADMDAKLSNAMQQ